jgi:hypothetical protein
VAIAPGNPFVLLLQCDGCGEPVPDGSPAWVEEFSAEVRLQTTAGIRRGDVRRVWHVGCLLPNSA